ncbi:MAG: hypothetical protein WC763_06085 [Candidatus Paceibacterota bacterium]|jgi:hypothetical protein
MMRSVGALWNRLTNLYSDADMWFDVDPVTYSLVYNVRVSIDENSVVDDELKKLLAVVKGVLGEDGLGAYIHRSSKGRGRKKRGGIDPDRSLTLRIDLKGDIA